MEVPPGLLKDPRISSEWRNELASGGAKHGMLALRGAVSLQYWLGLYGYRFDLDFETFTKQVLHADQRAGRRHGGVHVAVANLANNF
jgi:hypothetical protein